jgi:uncharacterized protein YraI
VATIHTLRAAVQQIVRLLEDVQLMDSNVTGGGGTAHSVAGDTDVNGANSIINGSQGANAGVGLVSGKKQLSTREMATRNQLQHVAGQYIVTSKRTTFF